MPKSFLVRFSIILMGFCLIITKSAWLVPIGVLVLFGGLLMPFFPDIITRRRSRSNSSLASTRQHSGTSIPDGTDEEVAGWVIQQTREWELEASGFGVSLVEAISNALPKLEIDLPAKGVSEVSVAYGKLVDDTQIERGQEALKRSFPAARIEFLAGVIGPENVEYYDPAGTPIVPVNITIISSDIDLQERASIEAAKILSEVLRSESEAKTGENSERSNGGAKSVSESSNEH